jgi:hypothetical protein
MRVPTRDGDPRVGELTPTYQMKGKQHDRKAWLPEFGWSTWQSRRPAGGDGRYLGGTAVTNKYVSSDESPSELVAAG